jgi:5-(carboxyamino)imidazole ribonucleotide synthase
LGLEVVCAGQHGDCAERVATVVEVDLSDAAAVAAFAATVDLVTIESENIDAAVLQGLNLYPNARAVGIAQDRLLEKRFFRECGIEVAPFAQVDSLADLEGAMASIGLPAILKTRRMGYDGKGQVRIYNPEEAASAWAEIGGLPCILEGMVAFDAEVSLLAARAASGAMVFYPLVRNHHREGILRTSIAPFVHEDLQALAEGYLRLVLERLEYVGVLAVEFFVQNDTLLANEMAPRVHNSGHWTIEGSATSQFANHLRAIAALPLGATESRPTVMLNCIGTMPPAAETAAFPGLFRHDYGKQPRPGRKVGHLTFPATETEAIAEWQRRLGG